MNDDRREGSPASTQLYATIKERPQSVDFQEDARSWEDRDWLE